MKRAIIFHGTQGSPEGNWFRWLEGELRVAGLEVWLPQLPGAEQPSLRAWSEFVRAKCPFVIDNDTLLIGHSSGAILALVVVQENAGPVGAVVGASIFCDNSLMWAPNNRLFDVALDYPAIKAKASQIILVHSDNDPYAPLEQARFVADNSGGELVVWSGQGHFNLEMGKRYRQFPELLELMSRKGLVKA